MDNDLSKLTFLLHVCSLSVTDIENVRVLCQDFVRCCSSYMPEFSKRLKTHLFLHIADHLSEFGPLDCYNTERSAVNLIYVGKFLSH